MNGNTESSTNALQSLVSEVGAIVCEVAEQLETTSGGISHELMKAGDWNTDLIVKLQGFDRMWQQLTAVSVVLQRSSELISHCEAPQSSVEDIVAEVSMRQTRHRLQSAIATEALAPLEPGVTEEQVF